MQWLVAIAGFLGAMICAFVAVIFAPVRPDFFPLLGAGLAAVALPAVMPMPAFVLRVLLGEMSQLLLGGQRATPARLLEAGFTFQFTDLRAALEDVAARP